MCVSVLVAVLGVSVLVALFGVCSGVISLKSICYSASYLLGHCIVWRVCCAVGLGKMSVVLCLSP